MLITDAPALPVENARRPHYIGILLAYVESINPTDAERIQMGLLTPEMLESGKVKPVSYQEEDGRHRIDFWLKGKDENGNDVRARHSVFVANEDARASGSGNVQVINTSGKTAYIPQAAFDQGQSPYDWFSAPYHRARTGESDLVQFINAWTNKKADAAAVPLDFAATCKGNLKGLHQILASDKASYVKVMLGVRTADDGRRYQNVFSRVVMPAWMGSYEKLHKELANYLHNATSRNDYGMDSSAPYDRRLYRLRLAETPGEDRDEGQGETYAPVSTVAQPYRAASAANAMPDSGSQIPMGGDDSDLPF